MSNKRTHEIDAEEELRIRKLFNGLTTTLSKIKTCTVKNTNELYGNKNLDGIAGQIFSFKTPVALKYINGALQEIKNIRALGIKVVSNVKKEIGGAIDGDEIIEIDDNPDVTEEELVTNAKLFIDDLINKSENELLRLKDEVINRDGNLSGTSQNIPNKESSELHASFEYHAPNPMEDNIGLLFKSLIAKKLIHHDTSLPDFRKIFSGKMITTRIVWTGYKGQLAYFIRLIHNRYKKVVFRSQMHFIIASQCFIKPNSSAFTIDELRWQPTPSPASAKEIEKLAKVL